MTRIADLRRRFDAISHAFSGTIAAKLIKLTDDQRLAYNDWRDRMAIFCASYPDGEAYARIIDGEAPPPLRRDVQMTLFGATISIPLGATDTQAAEAYNRIVHGS
jgi:hypothetical protein